jgi:hypothetical protein
MTNIATAQVNSIQDAIDFLQRLEVIEGNNESYRKSNPVPDSQQHSQTPRFQNFHKNDRQRYNNNNNYNTNNGHYVRQMNVSHQSHDNQNRRYWQNDRSNYSGSQQNNRNFSTNQQPLNPNAENFRSQDARNGENRANNAARENSEN